MKKYFKFTGTPYKFQAESVRFALRRQSAGLLLDLGLGKTYCSIQISRYRLMNGQINKILVVAPTSILYNWKSEIEKWSEYNAIVLHAPKKERIELIRNDDYTFYIINYEALLPFYEELAQKKFDMGIFDETARYIKNYTAKRTKASILLADRMAYKLILTGTPITNKPLDIWSQFRVLDGGKTFFKNFFYFRNKYFYKKSFSSRRAKWNEFYLKRNMQPILTEEIYKSCIRFKKEDCLDLPEKIFSTIEINPTPYLSRVYTDVREEILEEINKIDGVSKLNIQNILTKLLRLQQITSGFLPGKEGDLVILKDTPKLDALAEQVELITDADESVVIWCRFIKSIDLIESGLNKMGIKTLSMSGRTKDKYSKWKRFQKSKSINVFIAQVESGGIGTELFKKNSNSRSQHMVFYENTWSSDVREQAINRIHRIGQNSTCRYIDLIVRGTIDEQILNSLKKNMAVAEAILKQKGQVSLFI